MFNTKYRIDIFHNGKHEIVGYCESTRELQRIVSRYWKKWDTYVLERVFEDKYDVLLQVKDMQYINRLVADEVFEQQMAM